MEAAKLLTELNDHLRRAQNVLAAYLPGDGRMSERQAITALLAILDGRELHHLQAQIPERSVVSF